MGSSSKTMMYNDRSPRTRADSRKSRLRSDSAWARSWFAPYDQPVATRTSRITKKLPPPAYLLRMMISGNVGTTRKTLVKNNSTSSANPPRYAAETPIRTDRTVAKKPAITAMSNDSRVP